MIKYLWIAALMFFTLSFAVAQGKTVAVIKSYSGEIEIQQAGKPVETRPYLPLTNGLEVEVKENGSITLFMVSGKKLTFTGGAAFKLEDGVIYPINDRAREEMGESKMVYSRKDTLGSRSVTTEELPGELVAKLELIEETIEDEALKALLKGEAYKEYGFRQLAAKQFKLHNKIIKERLEQADSKTGAS